MAGAAHFLEFFLVMSGVFGGVVGIKVVIPPGFFHLVDEVNGAVQQPVAQVKGAVHI